MEFTLRQATTEDVAFAFQAVKRTMRDYAIQIWGNWLEEESKQEAIEETRQGLIDIIEYSGEPVGTLQVDRQGDCHIINKLYILPEHQNKGIGTALMQSLMDEARLSGIPLKLWVLRVNPAQRLYTRLGFNIEDETEDRIYMAYMP